MEYYMTSINQGVVYKLYIKNEVNDIYVGSTFRPLNKRLSEHKYDIKTQRWGKKKVEHFKDRTQEVKLSIIENCGNVSKNELLEKEKYYIDNLKPTLNKFCPIRQKGESNKIYYIKNKEIIQSKRKEIIKCPYCNIDIRRGNLNRHSKTKKCINYRENINN
tara:strand:- start:205 stop:687 length:483 start_codon:yes stop_codon:yes gene_type:complete